jgi:hypothetical protein
MKMHSAKVWSLTMLFLLGLTFHINAQLSFTSGVDPSAGPNGSYAAAEFYDFSNAGGIGKISGGTGNNLYGVNNQNWTQLTYAITFTYAPNYNEMQALVGGGGIGTALNIPSAPA